MGFEPTLPKGNNLAGYRLNHSAKVSFLISHTLLLTYWIDSYFSKLFIILYHHNNNNNIYLQSLLILTDIILNYMRE